MQAEMEIADGADGAEGAEGAEGADARIGMLLREIGGKCGKSGEIERKEAERRRH
jgi:hypothetical protein